MPPGGALPPPPGMMPRPQQQPPGAAPAMQQQLPGPPPLAPPGALHQQNGGEPPHRADPSPESTLCEGLVMKGIHRERRSEGFHGQVRLENAGSRSGSGCAVNMLSEDDSRCVWSHTLEFSCSGSASSAAAACAAAASAAGTAGGPCIGRRARARRGGCWPQSAPAG